MEARRVPSGARILVAVVIFVTTFLIARPSDPATQGQIAFWKHAAALFSERDVEGFVGIALLIGSTIVTVIGYQIAVRLIQRRLNKP